MYTKAATSTARAHARVLAALRMLRTHVPPYYVCLTPLGMATPCPLDLQDLGYTASTLERRLISRLDELVGKRLRAKRR